VALPASTDEASGSKSRIRGGATAGPTVRLAAAWARPLAFAALRMMVALCVAVTAAPAAASVEMAASPSTDQRSWMGSPARASAGESSKRAMCGGALAGGPTPTVRALETLPAPLVAVSTYVVVERGETSTVRPACAPSGAMVTSSARLTSQESVAVPPGAIDAGAATKLAMPGKAGFAPTRTLTVRVASPAAFAAVSVYVTLPGGETSTLAPVTSPTAGPASASMRSSCAPSTDQARVDDSPGPIAGGSAVKLAMAGGTSPTVTVAAAAALPPGPMVVRI
jgi:hypothetical protein